VTASAADGRYISETITIGGGEEAGAPETSAAAKPNMAASDTYAKLARLGLDDQVCGCQV
jgi:hypothetical protein